MPGLLLMLCGCCPFWFGNGSAYKLQARLEGYLQADSVRPL
jgi:hypothetical protein